MLREMTPQQYLEWRLYEDVEPFGDERGDLRFQYLRRDLANLVRDRTKNRLGYPLTDFLMPIGDHLPPGPTRRQSPQEHMSILKSIAAAYAPGVRAADQ